MTTFAEHRAIHDEQSMEDAKTGFSGATKWRTVYAWVLVIFAGLVFGMTVFSQLYA